MQLSVNDNQLQSNQTCLALTFINTQLQKQINMAQCLLSQNVKRMDASARIVFKLLNSMTDYPCEEKSVRI